jgi:DNA-binding Xre family transcriptional regulator
MRLSSMVVPVEQLAVAMQRRGLSSTDLARKAHLSHATISAVAAGKPVSARTLMKIASVLEAVAPLPGMAEIMANIGQVPPWPPKGGPDGGQGWQGTRGADPVPWLPGGGRGILRDA